jgi:hypothetical protein
MKLKSKRMLLVVLAISAVAGASAAYAAYTIYSNVVGVNLSYSVTITDITHSGSTISITAQVLDHSSGVSGVNVEFYESPTGTGSWTDIGSAGPTDGSGLVTGIFSAPSNGDYYFQASYTVP